MLSWVTMSRIYNASKRGFSLIELAAVIAVVSILAIAMAPSFTGQEEAALDAAAQTLANDLRFTRMSAVWSASPRSLIPAAGACAYIYDSANGAGKARDLSQIRRGIALTAQAAVSFNSLGESAAAASSMNLSLNGYSRTVAIAPFTGKITVR